MYKFNCCSLNIFIHNRNNISLHQSKLIPIKQKHLFILFNFYPLLIFTYFLNTIIIIQELNILLLLSIHINPIRPFTNKQTAYLKSTIILKIIPTRSKILIIWLIYQSSNYLIIRLFTNASVNIWNRDLN